MTVAQRERAGTMPADIRERAQYPVLSPHHDDRDLAYFFYDMVAGIGQLIPAGHELPAACEYRSLFHGQHVVAEVIARRQCACQFQFLYRIN